MNLALNIVSGVVILVCLIYIFKKKDKNIGVLVMSSLLLAALLAQIVLDEVVRAQMLAMESMYRIKRTVAIVQIIDWAKGFLIFILAIYYYYISTEKKEKDESEENKEMEEEA